MKKVVFEIQETISINSINDNSFIGIIANENKILIMRSPSGFFGYDKNDLDLSGKWYKDTLKDYINSFKTEKTKIFAFDTKEELFTWFNS